MKISDALINTRDIYYLKAAITGPVGWAIAGAIGAWVVSNAWMFAERASSALIRGRGVDFYIGWQW